LLFLPSPCFLLNEAEENNGGSGKNETKPVFEGELVIFWWRGRSQRGDSGDVYYLYKFPCDFVFWNWNMELDGWMDDTGR